MGTALGLVMSVLVTILGVLALRLGLRGEGGAQARVGGSVITVIGVIGIIVGVIAALD